LEEVLNWKIKNNMDMKKEKLKEYLAPSMELFQFALEKGFAISGDSDHVPTSAGTNNNSNNPFGQFQEGSSWTSTNWAEDPSSN
jgi:hypothetical protein